MNAQTRNSNDEAAIIRGQRALEMAEKYAAGATLQELGDYYGITRERVRQLMNGELGVTGKDGGKAQRSAVKRKTAAARRELDFMRRYGMREATFKHIQRRVDSSGTRPISRYRRQKHNAKVRGIAWKLTFAEWWQSWAESGKWLQRGRGQGYCMARHSDRGAYEVGNVKIIRATENQSEYIRRYWKQVRTGSRPLPRYKNSNKNSKLPLDLQVGQTIELPITNKLPKYAQNSAHDRSRARGWKIKTKVTGLVLTVTRLA